MIWNTFEIALFFVLLFCFTAQLLFYWVVLAKPYYYMQSSIKMELSEPTEAPPVSVIISIKNSQDDLFRFLPYILEQEYPEFEVIVVTDGISDAEEEALIHLKNRYSNLYSTHVPENTRNVSRIKLALTLGIKAAKYDKLLFTECDSYIRTKDWIHLMTRRFSDRKTVVLGFSALDEASGLSRKYMAYDYFFSNLQMISLALFNHPYSGNGRNMAYSKEHFIEQKGFVKHRVLRQGEDDLFINDIATGENTAVELSAQSVTLTEINDYRDWIRQKTDRMLTKRFYKRGPVAFWRLETFSRIGFFTALIICLICGLPYTSLPDFLLPGIALFCFIVRFFSQLTVINKINEYLELKKSYLTILLYDLFQPIINLYFFIHCVLKKKENYTYRYEKR
ncbi:MAG: glycosyltransferase [Candidatus Azobacteroides sp.]|nr:glycosyltransferase [Candidatus Azobacteroides sp.]